MSENKPQCGMCKVEWVEGHEKTPIHMMKVEKMKQIMALHIYDNKEIEERINDPDGIFGKERRGEKR
jgi:hypothetical protein